MEHSVLGSRWVYDGPHDPIYVAGLVDTILTGAHSDVAQASHGSNAVALGSPTGFAHGTLSSSTVLTGEQSNTSIICRMTAPGGGPAEPLIVKVFRTVQDGDNPDVVVQSALSRAGSTRVPLALGHLAGAWDDPTGSGAEHRGHLAFAQEFIPGVEDAWRVALVAAASGTDFTARARDLGVVTAEIHLALASTLGREEATPEARDALARSMQQTYAAAVASASELEVRAADVQRLLESAGSLTWPPLQRIHGDYHLGQVLLSNNDFVIIDFEGEPARTLEQRRRKHSPLRDVAGMIRSFNYAARAALARLPWEGFTDHDMLEAAALQWEAETVAVFNEAYAAAASHSILFDEWTDMQEVLRLFILEKTLYELRYELAHRPDWIGIPMGGLRALFPLAPIVEALPSGGAAQTAAD
jgi:1,4-alpha-glucan branching enzyme